MTKRALLGAIGITAFALAAGACGSSGGHAATSAPPPQSASTKPSTTTTTLEKPKPYDPTKPVDLGGTPGVTPAERHRAETLVTRTIADLRKYTYPSEAIAAGYRSIGDALTGDEH